MFFSFRNWVRKLRAPRRSRPERGKPRRYQPELEQLERRWLMAQGVNLFTVPGGSSFPLSITTGPDNNLWFTESAAPGVVGKVTTGGTFTQYSVNSGTTRLLYDLTSGPDGALWYTAQIPTVSPPQRPLGPSDPINATGLIGRLTTSGSYTEYFLFSPSNPHGITSGPDGNLWFTDPGANAVGKITTGGTITEYTLPNPGSGPEDIVTGPVTDPSLWFTENGGNRIGKITPAGVITEYAVPTAGSGPYGITVGPDNNLWFTENSAGQVARVTTGGCFAEYPGGSQPEGIVSGPDNSLWFAEMGQPGANLSYRVGKISTQGVLTEYAVAAYGLSDVAQGPDGNVWFTVTQGNQVGQLLPWKLTGDRRINDPAQGFFPPFGAADVSPNTGNLHVEDPLSFCPGPS